MKLRGLLSKYAGNVGIALIELMIVVVLFSTIATAYWNFRVMRDNSAEYDAELIESDDSISAALDEIGHLIRLARPEDGQSEATLFVEQVDDSDRIQVRHNGQSYFYYIDNRGNLIRRIGSECTRLVEGVVSLRVFSMGAQTIVITLSMRETVSSATDQAYRSYSRVIGSKALSGLAARRRI